MRLPVATARTTYEPPEFTAADACVTCGAPMHSAYCPQCGERRAADRPHGLRDLADEAWDAFSPVDGRIGRTLWTLLRRPGELTLAYMRGVRLPYVPPLRLFLIVNVLFFLHATFSWEGRVRLPGLGTVPIAIGGNHTFDTPLVVHLQATAHRLLARRALLRHVPPRRGETSDAYNVRIAREYAPRFDRTTTTQAKSLVVVMVPMFALLVALLEWRRRRHALQDLVFALHAIAVMLVAIMLTRYVVWLPVAYLLALTGTSVRDIAPDAVASAPMVAGLAVWLGFGLRRAYGDGKLAAWIKAIALSLGFGLVLFSYRALLFFTTLYAT